MNSLSTCIAILLASFGGDQVEVTVPDSVDLIEINHHFDENGWLVMEQVVFYQWCPVTCRYRVRDWRPLKSFHQIPRKDFHRDVYVASWKDGRHYREVTARQFRETWTTYDPELVDSLLAPKQHRKILTKPSVKTK